MGRERVEVAFGLTGEAEHGTNVDTGRSNCCQRAALVTINITASPLHAYQILNRQSGNNRVLRRHAGIHTCRVV